jgi:hypothetical protein
MLFGPFFTRFIARKRKPHLLGTVMRSSAIERSRLQSPQAENQVPWHLVLRAGSIYTQYLRTLDI